MESVNIYLQRIEELLSSMEDLLEASRPVPLGKKVSVDKHALYDIIDDLRPVLDDLAKDLPIEIMQAKRVVSDSDRIINDARTKAAQILENAESEVGKLVNEHEIYKLAVNEASQIIDEAKKSAREMRINAMEYADELLAGSERIMRKALDDFSQKARDVEADFTETLDILYENRQELRGTKRT